MISYRTAGTVGAVVTCPLEVVKTRLQSSRSFLVSATVPNPTSRIIESSIAQNQSTRTSTSNLRSGIPNNSSSFSSGRISSLGTSQASSPHPSSHQSPSGSSDTFTRHEQRRKLSTTFLRNRSQPQVIGGLRRVREFHL